MPRTRGRTKEIRCYIDPEAARKYAAHFPDRSAFSWALQTAVEAILRLVDGTPTNSEVIALAMKDAVTSQRLKHKRALNERADTDPADAPFVDTVTVERISPL